MALAQHSLYGKCYVSAIIHLALVVPLGIPYMEFFCRCHSTTGRITSLALLPFGLRAPGKQKLQLNRRITSYAVSCDYLKALFFSMTPPPPPVVVMTEVDQLTKDAQHALRRTMEKYMGSCRLILCSNSTSKVIPAIRSRCLGVRVPAPSIEEVCTSYLSSFRDTQKFST